MTLTAPREPRRVIYWWAAICGVLVVIVGALIIALLASQAAGRANKRSADAYAAAAGAAAAAADAGNRAQAACQLYKLLGESVPSPGTSALGLRIIAGTRLAYVNAGCSLGKLAKVDPRIAPFLPPGLR